MIVERRDDLLPVLTLPGIGNSGPEHWHSQWERLDCGLERVLQDDWDSPHCQDWVRRLTEAVGHRKKPVVFAAHSAACIMVAHWAQIVSHDYLRFVKGVLLVAPSDPIAAGFPIGPLGFDPVPLDTLPFESLVVASSDDPLVTPDRARQYACAWGSRFVNIGTAGHINTSSGHGPWPEGFALLNALRRRKESTSPQNL